MNITITLPTSHLAPLTIAGLQYDDGHGHTTHLGHTTHAVAHHGRITITAHLHHTPPALAALLDAGLTLPATADYWPKRSALITVHAPWHYDTQAGTATKETTP